MKKKILIWESSNKISGGQRMSLLISSFLLDEFDIVYCIPSKGSFSDELDRLKIRYYFYGDISLQNGKKSLTSMIRYFSLSKMMKKMSFSIIKKEHPNVLYACGPTSLSVSVLCAKKFRLPLVWHIHHIFIDKKTKFLLKIRSKSKFLKKIVCVSNYVANQINSNDWKKKCITVYNPVDFNKYSNFTGSFDEELKSLLKNDVCDLKDFFVLLHIGNLQKEKNQLFSIKVANEISKTRNVILLLAGKTTDPFYEKLIDNEISKFKNNKNLFIFKLGNRNDINELIHSSSAMLIPSIEGYPLAGLEAMCQDLPIIASDSSGSVELIKNANSGFVYCFNDLNSCINSFNTLFNNKNVFDKNGSIYVKNLGTRNYEFYMKGIFKDL